MKSTLVLLVSLYAASSRIAVSATYDAYSERVARFVEEVCFNGDPPQEKSVQLPDGFSVFIDCQERSLRTKAVALFDAVAKPTGLTYAWSTDPAAAQVCIYLGPFPKLLEIATQKGLATDLKTGAACPIRWTGNFVSKATIFVCTDTVVSSEHLPALVQRYMGVFGILGMSSEFRETCRRPKSKAAALQPLDKKLLQFVYQNVPPGTTREELKMIVKEKWAAQSAPSLF